MPHGGECAFNGVGGPQVLPMLSREVVERQQRLAVLRQATHRLVVFDGVSLDKGVEGGVGVDLRLGHPDSSYPRRASAVPEGHRVRGGSKVHLSDSLADHPELPQWAVERRLCWSRPWR